MSGGTLFIEFRILNPGLWTAEKPFCYSQQNGRVITIVITFPISGRMSGYGTISAGLAHERVPPEMRFLGAVILLAAVPGCTRGLHGRGN